MLNEDIDGKIKDIENQYELAQNEKNIELAAAVAFSYFIWLITELKATRALLAGANSTIDMVLAGQAARHRLSEEAKQTAIKDDDDVTLASEEDKEFYTHLAVIKERIGFAQHRSDWQNFCEQQLPWLLYHLNDQKGQFWKWKFAFSRERAKCERLEAEVLELKTAVKVLLK